MRAKKCIELSLISAMLMGGAGVSLAASNPVKVLNQTGETPTKIILKDNDAPIDPLNPNVADQKYLKLVSVPSGYEFETFVQQGTYNLASTVENQNIEVFNDRSKRDWYVVAKVLGNKIEVKDDASKSFAVTSFKMNDTELASTGATGIVSKAIVNGGEKNTGTILTPVNKVEVSFSDDKKVLKMGNELNGKIEYQLYNTPENN